jgi:polyphenol oxidase
MNRTRAADSVRAAEVPEVPAVPDSPASPDSPDSSDLPDSSDSLIVPEWKAPAGVAAFFTTRRGGVSTGPWGDAKGGGGLNLGAGCGDEPQRVVANRRRLEEMLGFPIRWVHQVHGAEVREIAGTTAPGDMALAQADAQVTTLPGTALGVLVADCLPVLLADRDGTVVAAAHAGWRGLASGVLENTVTCMRRHNPRGDILAWLGPCIGPSSFEVGEDVVDAFVSRDPRSAIHFARAPAPGKWLADLAALAALRLAQAGVADVVSHGGCTVLDPARFWSYRRDGRCGRMAGVIALRP